MKNSVDNKSDINSKKSNKLFYMFKKNNKKNIDLIPKKKLSNAINIKSTLNENNKNIIKTQLSKNIKENIVNKQIISNQPQKNLEKNNVVIKCVDIEKEIKTASFSSIILKNINLEIIEGEIVIILGPSGSGKTTLLNIIASIDKPSKGDVYIDDVIVNKLNDKKLTKLRREKISYIYQRYGLIPISTVFDNIKLGQNLVKKENRQIDFDMVIDKTGLKDYLSKFPHELSGGQKQRVAIARAILKQPRLMLCDEPTGALDEETSKKIIDLFLMINREYKATIVMVTHNNDLVRIANKVVYIKDGFIEKIEYKKN